MSRSEEETDLQRKVRKQEKIIVVLGIVIFVIYLVIAYFFRESRFPLPSPFP